MEESPITFDLPESMIEGVEELPELENPPNAARQLQEAPRVVGTPENPPRIGGYQLVARFRSSSANDVFLGLKMARFGYSRRGIVKFVARGLTDYDKRSRQLFDEALAIAALDHPNVVKILDVGENELGAYLAIEYVDGTDLRRALTLLEANGKTFTVEIALHLIAEILSGLEHAHTARDPNGQRLALVHRDVNPSNVLIARTGHVKLADFGMVKMKERLQNPTAPRVVKGKYRYMSPEYIADQEVSPAVDVFSTGVVLFEFLCGCPWIGNLPPLEIMKKIVYDGIPIERLSEAKVPRELIEVVRRAVASDVANRYVSAAAMREAIELWLQANGGYVSPSIVAKFLRQNKLV